MVERLNQISNKLNKKIKKKLNEKTKDTHQIFETVFKGSILGCRKSHTKSKSNRRCCFPSGECPTHLSLVAFNISVMAIHFSRICEELIIWSSSQFNYAQLPEELCTGSSIMPQKKNPDMAELVRGGSAKTVGNLMTLLSLSTGSIQDVPFRS